MKGPTNHLKFSIKRLWECPECHRREWSDGSVVNRRCGSAKHSGPVWMQLIEGTDLKRPVEPAQPSTPPAAPEPPGAQDQPPAGTEKSAQD